jgi:hypothetical protein
LVVPPFSSHADLPPNETRGSDSAHPITREARPALRRNREVLPLWCGSKSGADPKTSIESRCLQHRRQNIGAAATLNVAIEQRQVSRGRSLLDAIAREQAARDNQRLDLVRALADHHQRCIAVKALDGKLDRVAIAT